MSFWKAMAEIGQSLACQQQTGNTRLFEIYRAGRADLEREEVGPFTGIPLSWDDAGRRKQLDDKAYSSWEYFLRSL